MRKLKGVRHFIQNNLCALIITKDRKRVAHALGFKITSKRQLISVEEFDKLMDALAQAAKFAYRQNMLFAPGVRKAFELEYSMTPKLYPKITKK